ncbi:hypothetical protein D3C79_756890 [compost metagenome]
MPPVPARAVWRHAPAGADCHCPGRQPAPDHRRRTHQRAGRDGAAQDPRSPATASGRARHFAADHHPRPGHGHRPRRPPAGDEARRTGGARPTRADCAGTAAPIHPRPAQCRTGIQRSSPAPPTGAGLKADPQPAGCWQNVRIAQGKRPGQPLCRVARPGLAGSPGANAGHRR